ncbi:MAG: hypothetical protein H6Q42_3473 [Deltaproteobacteria bacterium]|nr:hypothetical protein [Deltaproteobacteria bacterium]
MERFLGTHEFNSMIAKPIVLSSGLLHLSQVLLILLNHKKSPLGKRLRERKDLGHNLKTEDWILGILGIF